MLCLLAAVAVSRMTRRALARRYKEAQIDKNNANLVKLEELVRDAPASAHAAPRRRRRRRACS